MSLLHNGENSFKKSRMFTDPDDFQYFMAFLLQTYISTNFFYKDSISSIYIKLFKDKQMAGKSITSLMGINTILHCM